MPGQQKNSRNRVGSVRLTKKLVLEDSSGCQPEQNVNKFSKSKCEVSAKLAETISGMKKVSGRNLKFQCRYQVQKPKGMNTPSGNSSGSSGRVGGGQKKVFFMTNFYGTRGAMAPRPPPGSATGQSLTVAADSNTSQWWCL